MRSAMKRIACLLALGIAVAGLSSPGHSASQRTWNSCKSAVDAQAAIRACTRIIKGRESRKHKGAAYTNRGSVYTVLVRDYERAIADFNKAVKLFPNFNAYYNRGYIYAIQGKSDVAIRDLSKALKYNANSALAYTYRGFAYAQKRNFRKAYRDLNKALRIDGGNADAYHFRGYAFTLQKKYENAVEDFTNALRINPNSDAFLNDRAYVYQEMGQPRLALKDASEAIRINPNNAKPYIQRSRALLAIGMAVQARSDLEKAISIDPSHKQDSNYPAFLAKLEGAEKAKPAQPIATAANPDPLPFTAAPVGRRVALVIGNSKYSSVASLPNPGRDASAVADAFRTLGFAQVTQASDLSKAAMERALLDFADTADGADWAVVYYAGHGMEMNGRNYVIPVDANIKRDRHVKLETVSLDDIVEAAGGARKFKLVILDACRDNPFLSTMKRTSATRSIGRGLARVEPSSGVLVAYAARAGQVALDGDGDQSPYVSALLKHMHEPGLDVSLMFRKVRDTVMRITGNQQQPFTYGSLPGERLSFKPVK